MNGKANEKEAVFNQEKNLFKGVDKIVGGIDFYASPLYEAPCYFGGLKNCCTFAHAERTNRYKVGYHGLTLLVCPFVCYTIL